MIHEEVWVEVTVAYFKVLSQIRLMGRENVREVLVKFVGRSQSLKSEALES
jgi:hypothetical protein